MMEVKEHEFSLGWINGEKIGSQPGQTGRHGRLKMINSEWKVFRAETLNSVDWYS